jgi:hypothetical protein
MAGDVNIAFECRSTRLSQPLQDLEVRLDSGRSGCARDGLCCGHARGYALAIPNQKPFWRSARRPPVGSFAPPAQYHPENGAQVPDRAVFQMAHRLLPRYAVSSKRGKSIVSCCADVLDLRPWRFAGPVTWFLLVAYVAIVAQPLVYGHAGPSIVALMTPVR